MKKMIMIAGGALLLVGASVGGTIFFVGSGEPAVAAANGEGGVAAPPAAPKLETFYHAFEPEFVVNFSGKSRERFFMADVSVATTDEEVIEVLEKHNPELRNDLLMLFGNQDGAYISTADGKMDLRAQTLEVVKKVVEKHYGAPRVDEIFFTKFVVQ